MPVEIWDNREFPPKRLTWSEMWFPCWLLVAAIGSVVILYTGLEGREKKRKLFAKQMIEQNCVHTGYTGRDTRIYQCDDGLRLEGEVR